MSNPKKLINSLGQEAYKVVETVVGDYVALWEVVDLFPSVFIRPIAVALHTIVM